MPHFHAYNMTTFDFFVLIVIFLVLWCIFRPNSFISVFGALICALIMCYFKIEPQITAISAICVYLVLRSFGDKAKIKRIQNDINAVSDEFKNSHKYDFKKIKKDIMQSDIKAFFGSYKKPQNS